MSLNVRMALPSKAVIVPAQESVLVAEVVISYVSRKSGGPPEGDVA